MDTTLLHSCLLLSLAQWGLAYNMYQYTRQYDQPSRRQEDSMVRAVRCAVSAFWLGLVSAALLQGQPAKDLSIRELEGAWRQVDGAELLHFKSDQMFSWAEGKLTILGVVHRRAETLVLRNAGELETWQASLQDGVLRMGHAGESKAYRRLQSIPPEVDLQPAKLGNSCPLQAERVQAIQKEIDERFQH